ncbi:MAG: hypothetical protein P4M11_07110 [Candidatus Pacebacteria bacterium]|nr:hypothetical protein [Candidatus Paceibacterota bacterium]
MKEVLEAEWMVEDKRKFALCHSENGERKSIEYEVANEQIAVEIVTKIKYFMVSSRKD